MGGGSGSIPAEHVQVMLQDQSKGGFPSETDPLCYSNIVRLFLVSQQSQSPRFYFLVQGVLDAVSETELFPTTTKMYPPATQQ